MPKLGQPPTGLRERRPEVGVERGRRLAVRRAEGSGFYTWETERIETTAGEWKLTTTATPVALKIPVPEGGSYLIRATASDADGRRARTETYARVGAFTTGRAVVTTASATAADATGEPPKVEVTLADGTSLT